MRKFKYIILAVIGLLASAILYHYGHLYFQQKVMDKKMTTFFVEESHIPESEILIIKDTYYDEVKNESRFIKYVTTKTDFNHWQEEIKRTSKFYNGDSVPKNYKPKPEDCELMYGLICRLPKKEVEFSYVLSGTYTSDKKIIKEHFAYPDIPFYNPE
jgi:hypothetical protein